VPVLLFAWAGVCLYCCVPVLPCAWPAVCLACCVPGLLCACTAVSMFCCVPVLLKHEEAGWARALCVYGATMQGGADGVWLLLHRRAHPFECCLPSGMGKNVDDGMRAQASLHNLGVEPSRKLNLSSIRLTLNRDSGR
jgi:hypothetical protein